MSDNISDYCYPNPSLTECDSNYLFIDFIIGGLCCIPIFYLAADQIIRYFKTRESFLSKNASFYLLSAFTFVIYMVNTLMPFLVSTTNAGPFYQSFSSCLFLLTYIIICEQIVDIMCMLNIKFSKLLKYIIVFSKYVFIIMGVVLAFMSYVYANNENSIDFYYNILNPVFNTGYYVLHVIVIIACAVPFVLLPRFYTIFSKEFIRTMRFLAFSIALFFVFSYISKSFEATDFYYGSLVYITYGKEAYIVTIIIVTAITEYIPRLLLSVTMYFLANVSNEETFEADTHTGDNVINQTLTTINEEDKLLFPT